jgi:hypothetical protein
VFSLFLAPYIVHGQFNITGNSTSAPNIWVKITSPKANQTVPIGELTIYGTSSDTVNSNCRIYADWNDLKPMQNATGVGSGGSNDYSNWTFTYTQKYHLISEGTNELTSKISCYPNSDNSNITSKYYSLNITGSNNSSPFVPTNGGPAPNSKVLSYHSLLPQYSNEHTNDSNNKNNNGNKIEVPDSNTYIEISNRYTSDDKYNGDKKNTQKIEFHTSSSLTSSKIGKEKNGQNIMNLKGFDLDPNHNELSKYIHNLIKEKLEKISDGLSR